MPLPLLAKPYPFQSIRRRVVQRALAFGGFVWLFLWLYAPFGLGNTGNALPWVSLGYGLITTAVMLGMTAAVAQGVPRFYPEDRWTVGHEICQTMVIIFFITLLNLLYSVWLGIFPWNMTSFLSFLGFTLGVGIFPVAIQTLVTQHMARKHYAGISQTMNQRLHPAATSPLPPPPVPLAAIALHDDEGHPALQLLPQDLLALEAADNYVKAHYLQAGALKSLLIRGALNRFEGELQAISPSFFRVHRSWLVNLRAMDKVEGNARGYQLTLNRLPQTVPVARRRLEAFEKAMR
jgi:hypothetical protein